MTITVKFFASLREQLGKSEILVTMTKPLTVAQVWALACNNATLPAHLLCAVNLEYVDSNVLVKEGDEVAFFPPVTGG
jgi:molybdopterin synthase sulfur carrier subunit